MRLGGILLLLAVSARAGDDDLLPAQWEVDRGGAAWFSAGSGKELLFPGDSGVLLTEQLASGGLAVLLQFVFPGPVDLASHSDAEQHFRRLGLGLKDRDLIERIILPVDDQAEGSVLRDRARLDRLLAVRLAGERNLTRAAPVLRDLTKGDDPFLARAAQQSLDRMIGGEVAPERLRLPAHPVNELPTGADLIVAIDYTRTPAWFGFSVFSRELGIERVRADTAAMGATGTDADLAEGQRIVDRAGEWFYEVARRFGNMRFYRMAMAVKLPPRLDERGAAGLELIVDGRFDVGRFAARFQAEKREVKQGKAGLTLFLAGGELTLQVSDSRMRVVQGEIADDGKREEYLARLKQAGFPGPALFVHLRRGAKLPLETALVPGLAGLVTATLTASFEEGVFLEFRGEYTDEPTARRTAGMLSGIVNAWKPTKEIAAILESIAITSEGKQLAILLDLGGTTLEQAVRLFAAAGGESRPAAERDRRQGGTGR